MEIDTTVLVSYLEPYLFTMLMTFGIVSCLIFLMYGIHKALMLFNV